MIEKSETSNNIHMSFKYNKFELSNINVNILYLCLFFFNKIMTSIPADSQC